jgi:crossover junction endodeoxyribonuclease RuvC
LKYIGIDPGISGAIAVYDMDTREFKFHDTPTVTIKSGKSFKNQMDPHAASLLLNGIAGERMIGVERCLVTIEKVAPMPSFNRAEDGVVEERRTMGATSAFNFGMGFGMWIGICAALQLPYELVHPATWKLKLLAGMARGKDASRVKAMQLFPQTAKDLARKKDHGRADALLLAVYGVKYGAPQRPAQQEELEPTLF